jgi:glutathione peroxidase
MDATRVNTHDFSVRAADGTVRSLRDYAGRVLLIVNVASKCGLTPQYEGLQSMAEEGGQHGLQILGFPCNQFGGQEPGSDAEIQEFCTQAYNVTFPVFAKIDVNGSGADPLYVYLRQEAPGDFGPANGALYRWVAKTRPAAIGTDEIKWNFTKFLIGRDGEVIHRFEPDVTPAQIRSDLEALLTG